MVDLPFEVSASSPFGCVDFLVRINESLDAPENNSYTTLNNLPTPTVMVDIETQQGMTVVMPVSGGEDPNLTNIVSNLPVSLLAPGAYVARVTATDWAGNQTTVTAPFVYQEVPPIITAPSAGATVAGKLVVQGTAVDPDWTTNNTYLGYTLYWSSGTQTLPTNLGSLGSNWVSTRAYRCQCLRVPKVTNRFKRLRTAL